MKLEDGSTISGVLEGYYVMSLRLSNGVWEPIAMFNRTGKLVIRSDALKRGQELIALLRKRIHG